ncbi:MAG: GGDEF domain-containing protein [Polyangiales bacterium]|jgi:GGDEF domain-containing protein
MIRDMRSALGAIDAYRLGGDEFCILAFGVHEPTQAGTILEPLPSPR